MGFLGFGNYDKEGPGVSKDEPKKKRLALFFELYFRKFWDIIKINLLFLITCIPIVTIGPALSGMTFVLRNYTREEHAFLWQDYWDAFKSNFKDSFIVGITTILLAGLSFFVSGFYYQRLNDSNIYYILWGISLFFMVAILFSSYYIYLMIVTLDLKLKDMVKNAIIFAFLGLKQNIFSLIGQALVVGLLVAISILVPIQYSILLIFFLLIFLVPATLTYISCFNSYPIIKKFCIDPYIEKMSGGTTDSDKEESEQDRIFSDKKIIKDNN